MKKVVFGMIASAFLCFTLASCGEKLMSEAEVQAKIDELYNQQAAGVASELDAECDSQFESKVAAEVTRMEAEAAAAAPAPEPTPAPAPAGKKK
jgi:predicted small lipoprotein YifL